MSLLNQASLIQIPSGYKEGTLYSAKPINGDGDLSFTRASNGTRINSEGLVEVCPLNLFEYSQTLTNGVWVGSNATYSGDTLTASAGTSFKGIYQNQTTQGQQTVFFDVLYTNHQWVQIGVGTVASDLGFANFDLQNKVVGNQSGGFVGSIQDFGTYTRIAVTFSTVDKTSVFLCFVNSGTSSRADATSSTGNIKLYKAQLNIGATAKTYFPTTDRLNVPRLTYPVGGGCPSLLLEKQSTNITLYSEQFDNAAYVVATNNGTLTRTANYGTSPDGTQNADRLQMSITSGTNHYSQLYQILSVTNGQTYTWSVWIKSLSGTPTIGWAYDGNDWDVVTLTSEWVRYTRTTTAKTGNINADFLLYDNISTSLSADILVWGYQIEQSSYATSYIPTTSSSATRVADACSKTGISSLIGQTEGTLFVDLKTLANNEFKRISINDGTFSNSIFFDFDSSNNIYLKVINGGLLTLTILGAFNFNISNKIAVAYKNNDYAFYINGTLQGTSTSEDVPSGFSVFQFSLAGNQFVEGNINQVALFPTRLTNAELASLTTL